MVSNRTKHGKYFGVGLGERSSNHVWDRFRLNPIIDMMQCGRENIVIYFQFEVCFHPRSLQIVHKVFDPRSWERGFYQGNTDFFFFIFGFGWLFRRGVCPDSAGGVRAGWGHEVMGGGVQGSTGNRSSSRRARRAALEGARTRGGEGEDGGLWTARLRCDCPVKVLH